MPLPPLPENNTDRVWVSYQAGTKRHEMMFRYLSAISLAEQIANTRAVVARIALSMGLNWTADGARRSVAGSTVSSPIAWGEPIGGAEFSLNIEPLDEPRFVTFIGRTFSGRQSKVTAFGYKKVAEGDYRLEEADDGNLVLVRGVLNDPANGFCAIDGSRPLWYSYFNVGYNAYWQRQKRRG